jgi:ribonuclease PH
MVVRDEPCTLCVAGLDGVCHPDNLCPAINAATLALMHAGVGMKDFVVACSAGYLERTPLLGVGRLCCQCVPL